MKKVNKVIIVVAIVLQSLTILAQSGDLQKAFVDSYTQEYNKKYNDAIAALVKVYSEKSYETNLRLGWLNYINGNYPQAQSYYQKAITLKPYSIEAKLGMVKPLSVLESWDKVLQQYEEILKIDPQNANTNYWAGVIYYNRKKYETAAKYFEKGVNLYPFDYDSNHMLGWTYLNLGRTQDAKILFKKALLSHPGDASATDGLSKCK